MQQKFINKALEISEKSMAKDHKHGAVCVVGGKIISTGDFFDATGMMMAVSPDQE